MTSDTEAAVQPAAGTAAVDAALDALELDYGRAYLIGYDPEHGYWAERRDRLGGLLETGTPDELRKAMAENHAMKAVAVP